MTALYTASPSNGLPKAQQKPPLLAARLLAPAFAVACLILIGLSAHDGLSDLYKRWANEEEYGYGFLVAAIVPLLLWGRWRLILERSGGSQWPGVVIVIIAQLCTIIAVLGKSYFIQDITLIATLLGLGVVIFGYGAFRILLPLAVLLALAIPLPYTLEAILTIKLQLLSTNIGVALIQLIGVPVYVEGNIIDLGTYKLQVAEACSGLRYLLPLTCISFLVAYLYSAAFWKRVLLVVSAAPITILINSFRIAVIAVLVNSFGIEMAEGFLHQFEGWVIFILGLLVLGLEILVLERFRWSNVELTPIMSRSGFGAWPKAPFRLDLPLVITVLVCAGTLGVTSSVASAMRSVPTPVRDSFSGFPRHLDDWTGQPAKLDAPTLGLLRPTDYYLGDFVKGPSDPPVNFYSVYYNSLAEGAAIHSPRVCLPGSGWEFTSLQERKFSELAPGVAGTYTYAVIQKGEQKILMYYWYQQRQRRTAGEFWMKYYLLVDNLFTSKTDGALVRLYTPITAAAGDRGEAEANAKLRNFARALFPKLPAYLPQ